MNKTKISSFFTLILEILFPTAETIKRLAKKSKSELMLELTPSKNIDPETTALFAYTDEKVKYLIWEIKYYQNQKMSELVGQLLAEKILKNLGDLRKSEKFFLIPIPLTKKRLRERGYNHTEMLAKSILRNLPENFSLIKDLLQKTRHTPKQNSIEDREKRFKNIAGAFSVANSNQVRGENILLIDDVITTGATIHEAKQALVSAGAKTVRAFAIGH